MNIDYHVELDGHYYSVPHRLVRTEVELRVTGTTVEILAGNQRVAVHAYSSRRGAHTTVAEHMPASHRAHREWTPQRRIAWGERIGAATAAVVRWQMEPFIERSAASVPLTCWGSNFDVQSGAAGFGTMGDAVLLGALQGQPHDMVVPLRSAQACGTPAQSGVLTCAHGHYFRERAVQQVMAEWLQPPRPIRVGPRLTLKTGEAAVPPPARAAGIVVPDTAVFRKKPP